VINTHNASPHYAVFSIVQPTNPSPLISPFLIC